MPRHWFEQTPRATIPTRAQSIEASLSFCLIYSRRIAALEAPPVGLQASAPGRFHTVRFASDGSRSEEHTSELQSLMRISYAVFCLKKKTKTIHKAKHTNS